ncbi:hypothetical protein WJX81_005115 [Elliptochloris bilobata]|uniref:Cilia- and flagella-associated protein 263 n=1 Tax=Elliptochloris bilobata TaxID=381761 RepID=A0AAW1S4M6_9CHLO
MADLAGAAEASVGLSEEEAEQRHAETLRGNERLRMENELLSAYLQRTDHRSAQPDPTSPQKRRRTHLARASTFGRSAQAPLQALGQGRLTAEEKCEVASAEMEAVQATADQAAAEAARALEEQAARCEAAEALDGDVGKYALKAAAAKAAVRRLEAALARRDDGADALRAVDLDQLQIENEQLLARVEQRNAELLGLKLTTGRSVQALASQMEALCGLTAHAEHLRSDLVDRRAALVRTAEDRTAAETALERAGRQLRALKGDAQGGVVEWRRKVSIATPPAALKRASASA